MEKSSLGDRMKAYEGVSKTSLLARTPVIIRLDGKAFHTYTKKMPRPFYKPLHDAMVETVKYLCEEIDTCQIGYTQSDEISLLLKDFTKFKTQAWFDNEVQKIVSSSAALATAIFNDVVSKTIPAELRNGRFGYFDSRAFNVPTEEVCNYFIWRQQDCTRNSINSVGQANFSQKELNGKNTDMVQYMLVTQANVNWNDFETWAKRGTCVRQNVNVDSLPALIAGESAPFMKSKTHSGQRWVVDHDIPVFTQERNYINDLLYRVQE